MTAPINHDKLSKLLALASSDNEAEAALALRKAKELLAGAGMDFKDVAERMKGGAKASGFDFSAAWAEATRTWQQPKPQPKPKGYTDKDGCTWESKAAYDAWCAQQAAYREAERQRYAPQRAAVLAKYGSEAAAIARDPREQALHEAALPWLEGPFSPEPSYEYLAGRWHEGMGGWKRYDFGKHPTTACRAAIEAAIPMPTTIREARDELRYWDERNDELCHALECWGEEQLDLPASYRCELVRALYETELPIVTLDDLHLRLQFAVEADTKDDVCQAAPSNLDAFERLVLNAEANAPGRGFWSQAATVQDEQPPARAAERRARVIAMLSNPDTAAWSDRAIAKAAGVSPTTVGALRRKVSTLDSEADGGTGG